MIKVIIADDHKIVVDGLVSILESEKNIQVVGTALNGLSAQSLLKTKKIDIAILDIEMPGLNGVELTQYIREYHPTVRVLILTMYKTKDFVKQIVKAGAKGYILKNKGSEDLVKAIEAINTGQSYIGQEITDVLFEALKEQSQKDNSPKVKLTKREKEVLSLIAKGLSSKEIGKELYIAPSTVDTHRKNLIEKLGVKSSKDLIIYAKDNKDILND